MGAVISTGNEARARDMVRIIQVRIEVMRHSVTQPIRHRVVPG